MAEGWMAKAIEVKMQDLIVAAALPLTDIRAMFRGEPFAVPVKLYPFATVFCASEDDTSGEEGYTGDTGPVVYRMYQGYVSVEVLHKDAASMVATPDRKITVPSHETCGQLTVAAVQAIRGWADPYGIIDGVLAVVSEDGKEATSQIRVGAIRYSLQTRFDNVSQTGTFEWTVFSRREEF